MSGSVDGFTQQTGLAGLRPKSAGCWQVTTALQSRWGLFCQTNATGSEATMVHICRGASALAHLLLNSQDELPALPFALLASWWRGFTKQIAISTRGCAFSPERAPWPTVSTPLV